MDLNSKIKEFREIVINSDNIVFFGGAGVSTESGIPDFRSKDGLYNQKYKYPPEAILSHTFFVNETEEFYKFYKDKLNAISYEPNITHYKLAELEKEGKLKAAVTQNIDGLHQKAGSQNVYELHGSVYRNYCTRCKEFYGPEYIFNDDTPVVPICTKCGGVIKPDVVLYEEALDDEVVSGAINAISTADTLIVGGTSLTVYPASGLVRYFRGKNLVLINKDETPYDNMATLVIHESLGNVFKNL